MRSHPSKQLDFGDYYRLRTAAKDDLQGQENREKNQRLSRMQRKRCSPFAERGINLNNMPGGSLVGTIIQHQQWGHFIRTPPNFDAAVVREFYANMIPGIYCERHTVMVRGKRVRISADDICTYHGAPRHPELNQSYGLSPHEAFHTNLNPIIAGSLRRNGEVGWDKTNNHILKSDLHYDLAFLMLFVKASLKPSSHNTTADSQVAEVLFSLQQNLPMDIGHIIWMEILDAGFTLDGILPFPCLITHFCRAAGVEIGRTESPKGDFSARHYHIQLRAAADLERRRQPEVPIWEAEEAAESDGDDDYEPPMQTEYTVEHTGDTPPYFTRFENRMEARFNDFEQRFDEVNERLSQAGIAELQRPPHDRRRVRGGAEMELHLLVNDRSVYLSEHFLYLFAEHVNSLFDSDECFFY